MFVLDVRAALLSRLLYDDGRVARIDKHIQLVFKGKE